MPSFPVGAVGLILSLFFIPFFIFEKHPKRFYYLFLIYSILALVMGLLMISGSYFTALDLWVFIRQFFVAFTVGYFLADFFVNQLDNYRSIVSIFSHILLFGLLIFVVFQFFLPKENLESNYLRFSESISLMGFVLIVLNRKLFNKVIIASIILVLLFLAESRFSLFAFLLSCSVYFFFISRKMFFYFLITFLAFLTLVLIVDSEIITGSRYFRLIFQPEQDTSLAARKELMDQGLKVASENQYFGSFGYHRGVCSGCYVHNAISYWIEFGIAGVTFVISNIVLILYSFVICTKRIVKNGVSQKNGYEVFMLFSIYILIGVLFSKHWNYTSFFILIGFSFFLIKTKLLKKSIIEFQN